MKKKASETTWKTPIVVGGKVRGYAKDKSSAESNKKIMESKLKKKSK